MSDSSFSILPPPGLIEISPYSISWQIACSSTEEESYTYFGVQRWQIIFPKCCGKHNKQGSDLTDTSIEEVKNKIHSNLSYAMHFFNRTDEDSKFMEMNTDYIDLVVKSFGDTELGKDIFIHNLQNLIDSVENFNQEQKASLVEYIKWNYLCKNEKEIKENLNYIQHIWFNLFPFDLPQFKQLKSGYADSISEIHHPTVQNQFGYFYKKRLICPEELVAKLTNETFMRLNENINIQENLQDYRQLVFNKIKENKLRLLQRKDHTNYTFIDLIMNSLDMELTREVLVVEKETPKSKQRLEGIFKNYCNGSISNVFYSEKDYMIFLHTIHSFFEPDNRPTSKLTGTIRLKHGAKKYLHPFLKDVWGEFKEDGYLKDDIAYLMSLRFLSHFKEKDASLIYKEITRHRA